MTCTRSAELWLQGKANLSADAVINLLRSDDGFAFLEELVGDAKPKWWSAFRRRVKAELLQQKIQELENELKGVRRGSDQ